MADAVQEANALLATAAAEVIEHPEDYARLYERRRQIAKLILALRTDER